MVLLQFGHFKLIALEIGLRNTFLASISLLSPIGVGVDVKEVLGDHLHTLQHVQFSFLLFLLLLQLLWVFNSTQLLLRETDRWLDGCRFGVTLQWLVNNHFNFALVLIHLVNPARSFGDLRIKNALRALASAVAAQVHLRI